MPNFDDSFKGFKKSPISYQGKSLYRLDKLVVPKACSITVRFVSTNSEWKQGIKLHVDKHFTFNGKRLGKHVILWENTAPQDTLLVVASKEGVLQVCNAWDTGRGTTDAWWGGAAMMIEDIPNGRRYYCNDGHPDDNFDDIVFEVTILPQQEQGS